MRKRSIFANSFSKDIKVFINWSICAENVSQDRSGRPKINV